MPKLKPVRSLWELKQLAQTDPDYRQLLLISASNLGGSAGDNVEKAYSWLIMNAQETDEEGVVGEVNFCLNLVKKSSK